MSDIRSNPMINGTSTRTHVAIFACWSLKHLKNHSVQQILITYASDYSYNNRIRLVLHIFLQRKSYRRHQLSLPASVPISVWTSYCRGRSLRFHTSKTSYDDIKYVIWNLHSVDQILQVSSENILWVVCISNKITSQNGCFPKKLKLVSSTFSLFCAYYLH